MDVSILPYIFAPSFFSSSSSFFSSPSFLIFPHLHLSKPLSETRLKVTKSDFCTKKRKKKKKKPFRVF